MLPCSLVDLLLTFTVPSGAPVGLNYTNLLHTSVTLLWSPPLQQQQNGDIVGYMLAFAVLGSHNATTFHTNTTSLEVAMLHPFTSYSFSVSAGTAVGFGPASQHFLLQTAEDGEQ